MSKKDNSGILWADRKHHLWFPISFTKYSYDNERLYISSGMFSSRDDECLLYRILDISLSRSFAQKFFGTGTIELNTRDRSTPIIRLENISNSREVKKRLSEQIESERRRNNVVGKDMYGSSAHYGPMDVDPDLVDTDGPDHGVF